VLVSLILSVQDRRYYSEIELSDLSTPRQPDRISLNLPSTSSLTSTSASTKTLTATAEEEGEDEGESDLDGMFRKKERERAMRDEIVLDWDGRLDNVSVALSFFLVLLSCER